jgi:hypothetical protein
MSQTTRTPDPDAAALARYLRCSTATARAFIELLDAHSMTARSDVARAIRCARDDHGLWAHQLVREYPRQWSAAHYLDYPARSTPLPA